MQRELLCVWNCWKISIKISGIHLWTLKKSTRNFSFFSTVKRNPNFWCKCYNIRHNSLHSYCLSFLRAYSFDALHIHPPNRFRKNPMRKKPSGIFSSWDFFLHGILSSWDFFLHGILSSWDFIRIPPKPYLSLPPSAPPHLERNKLRSHHLRGARERRRMEDAVRPLLQKRGAADRAAEPGGGRSFPQGFGDGRRICFRRVLAGAQYVRWSRRCVTGFLFFICWILIIRVIFTVRTWCFSVLLLLNHHR